MRTRVRGSAPDRFELNLTPLLDVVLQLITFFMILVHFGSRIEGENLEIRLPVAPSALPNGDLGLDRLVASVDREGRLLVKGEARDHVASAQWWDEQAKIRREGQRTAGELSTLVVIRADRAATYGAIRGLLAQAQRCGFARFALVVLREKEQP